MKKTSKIAVIGAGNWGTALASLLAEKCEKLSLWAYEPEVVEGICSKQRNPLFLPDLHLPFHVFATNDIAEALHEAKYVVSVVPSKALSSVWKRAADFLEAESILVSCTKGLEPNGFKLMSQVLDEVLPKHPQERRLVLSGPSFAAEVAAGLPTSVVIAGEDERICAEAQELFRTARFLPFTSSDVLGVQIGGALKNVVAIAAGLCDGLQLGCNARAALITRGLYEMMKVGEVFGAKRHTFSGLSGIGDLFLTASDTKSRNFSVGKVLAEGKSVKDILQSGHMIAEGIETAHAVRLFAQANNLHLPICESVSKILKGEQSPQETLEYLTSLELKEEMSIYA